MLVTSYKGQVPFKKALWIKIWVCAFLILVGIKCLLLVLLNQVGTLASLTSSFGIHLFNVDFMNGFYAGFGFALIVAGTVFIIKSVKLLKNDEKFKAAEIDFMDERNRFISSSTFATTSYIFFITLAFAVVISGMFNLLVFLTLLCTFFFYLIVFVVTYLIMKSKY